MKHQKTKTNLKKAQGMIARLVKMVDDERYCVDIASQVNATIGILKEVNKQILKEHLACCGKEKLASEDQTQVQEFIDELVRVWDVSSRK